GLPGLDRTAGVLQTPSGDGGLLAAGRVRRGDPAAGRCARAPALKEDETPYLVRLFNAHCEPAPDGAQIAILTRPENRPRALAGVDLATFVPAARACRDWLGRVIDAQLAKLRAAEEVLRTGKDAIERSRVVGPTKMIQD